MENNKVTFIGGDMDGFQRVFQREELYRGKEFRLPKYKNPNIVDYHKSAIVTLEFQTYRVQSFISGMGFLYWVAFYFEPID